MTIEKNVSNYNFTDMMTLLVTLGETINHVSSEPSKKDIMAYEQVKESDADKSAYIDHESLYVLFNEMLLETKKRWDSELKGSQAQQKLDFEGKSENEDKKDRTIETEKSIKEKETVPHPATVQTYDTLVTNIMQEIKNALEKGNGKISPEDAKKIKEGIKEKYAQVHDDHEIITSPKALEVFYGQLVQEEQVNLKQKMLEEFNDSGEEPKETNKKKKGPPPPPPPTSNKKEDNSTTNDIDQIINSVENGTKVENKSKSEEKSKLEEKTPSLTEVPKPPKPNRNTKIETKEEGNSNLQEEVAESENITITKKFSSDNVVEELIAECENREQIISKMSKIFTENFKEKNKCLLDDEPVPFHSFCFNILRKLREIDKSSDGKSKLVPESNKQLKATIHNWKKSWASDK